MVEWFRLAEGLSEEIGWCRGQELNLPSNRLIANMLRVSKVIHLDPKLALIIMIF